MPMYLTQFSYTPETWARLIENPEDRREAARTYIESWAESCTGSGMPSESTMAGICGRLQTTFRWHLSCWLSVRAGRSARTRPPSS